MRPRHVTHRLQLLGVTSGGRPVVSGIRIAVVDPHPLFREGIAYSLGPGDNFDIVGEGSTAEDALRVAQRLYPDVLLFDGSSGDRDLEAATLIKRQCPGVKIIIMAARGSGALVNAALNAGASGCIVKDIPGRELVHVVRAVHGGESYIAPSLAKMLLEQTPPEVERARTRVSALTRREKQVLAFVSDGLTNKEIARTLQISEKTVKHYMTSVMEKLDVRSRVEAAMVFLTTLSA